MSVLSSIRHSLSSVAALLLSTAPRLCVKGDAKPTPSDFSARLLSNTFWSFAGTLIARALGLLSAIVVARILGRHDFGALGLAQGTIGMFGIFAGCGTSLTVAKHIAELRQNQPARAGRILALCNAIVCSVGGLIALSLAFFSPWLANRALASSEIANLLRVGALTLVFDSINGVETGALAGFGAFKTVARVNLTIGLLSFPLLISGAFLAGVLGAVVAQSVTSLLNCLVAYMAVRQQAALAGVSISYRELGREFPVLWSFSLPAMLGSAVSGPAGWALNALLANQPQGYEQLGFYNAALRVKQMPESLLTMLAAPILPLLTESFARRDAATYRKILAYSVGLSSALIIPVSLLQLAVPSLTLLPYGPTYAGHRDLVQWLMLHAVAVAIFYPLNAVVVSMHRMWFSWAINLLFAALNLTLGFFLVPAYGVTGMVASTAISFSLANIPCALFTMSHQPQFFTRGVFLVMAIVATAAALSCAFARLHGRNLLALATGFLCGFLILAISVRLMCKGATALGNSTDEAPMSRSRAQSGLPSFPSVKKCLVTLKNYLRRSFPRFWQQLYTLRKDLVEYPHWSRRIIEVKKCPDNARIPRVTHAGRISNGCQIMHNGIHVLAGSYYGRGGQRLLRQNRGCHEPQEEFIFDQVLRLLPRNAVMLECGAYWAFYSIWFCKEIPGAAAYLIEPDPHHLDLGRKNFQLNGLFGNFFQLWVSSNNTTDFEGRETISLDALAQKQRIKHIDILHADIQGAELDMLRGAHSLLTNQAISFLFLSTHSEELHASCEKLLLGADYDPFISIPPAQSYSFDGLLVARSPSHKHINFEHPSRHGV